MIIIVTSRYKAFKDLCKRLSLEPRSMIQVSRYEYYRGIQATKAIFTCGCDGVDGITKLKHILSEQKVPVEYITCMEGCKNFS